MRTLYHEKCGIGLNREERTPETCNGEGVVPRIAVWKATEPWLMYWQASPEKPATHLQVTRLSAAPRQVLCVQVPRFEQTPRVVPKPGHCKHTRSAADGAKPIGQTMSYDIERRVAFGVSEEPFIHPSTNALRTYRLREHRGGQGAIAGRRDGERRGASREGGSRRERKLSSLVKHNKLRCSSTTQSVSMYDTRESKSTDRQTESLPKEAQECCR